MEPVIGDDVPHECRRTRDACLPPSAAGHLHRPLIHQFKTGGRRPDRRLRTDDIDRLDELVTQQPAEPGPPLRSPGQSFRTAHTHLRRATSPCMSSVRSPTPSATQRSISSTGCTKHDHIGTQLAASPHTPTKLSTVLHRHTVPTTPPCSRWPAERVTSAAAHPRNIGNCAWTPVTSHGLSPAAARDRHGQLAGESLSTSIRSSWQANPCARPSSEHASHISSSTRRSAADACRQRQQHVVHGSVQRPPAPPTPAPWN